MDYKLVTKENKAVVSCFYIRLNNIEDFLLFLNTSGEKLEVL